MIANETIEPAAGQVQAADSLGPLAPLAVHRRFLVTEIRASTTRPGKTDKLPVSPITLARPVSAHDPANWLDYATAASIAAAMGPAFGVGFCIGEGIDLFCLDLDECLEPDRTGWSPLSLEILGRLGGCVAEVSQSGRGLHIWGRGSVPPHLKKVGALGIELFSARRPQFVLLGTGARGTMHAECRGIAEIVKDYFPEPVASDALVPDDGPCSEWRGPTDDKELLKRAYAWKSPANQAAEVFGGDAPGVTLGDLLECNVEKLTRAYPQASANGTEPYDPSRVDFAAARQLAYWTGRDVARIERIMRASALARDKWDVNGSYLTVRTIVKACRAQPKVLQDKCTADEVVADMSMLSSEEILGQWVGRASLMNPVESGKLAEWVAIRTGAGKAALNADLKAKRTEQRKQAADATVATKAGPKELIEHRPDACTDQAGQVESLILRSAPPGEYVVFGGVLAQVTSRPLPHTHLIDQADAAPPDVPQIEPHNDVGVLRHVERVAAFYEHKGDGSKRLIAVPDRIVRVLMGKTGHAAPVLTGLVTHPIVLPAGVVLASDGLHQGTGLYVWNAPAKNARPYAQPEAVAALQRLRATVLEGFEFATPLDADIAIAGLLTAVQRRVLDSAPGLAVLASMQASGKTTLTRRLHILLTGRDMPASTFPFDNEAEASKQLLSMLLRGPAMVCFDNVPDGFAFRSGVLSAAMTSPEITQRILGVSKDATAPTNVFFALTGNNLSLGADEVTRWMIARLAPRTAHPEERRFRHPDVLAHGLACREQVLRDVVGIVAGCRLAGGTPYGSATRFPTWDKLVRQPLIWAGAADVAEVFRANRDQSEPVVALRGLVWALLRLFGDKPFTAASLATAGFGPSAEAAETLRTSLEMLGAKDAGSTVARGKVLKAQVGKVAEVDGSEWSVQAKADRKEIMVYSLVRHR